MNCQRCASQRTASVMSHAQDRHVINIVGCEEYVDYMPHDLGIGGGNDCSFTYCLDCGQIQGRFPLPITRLEQND